MKKQFLLPVAAEIPRPRRRFQLRLQAAVRAVEIRVAGQEAVAIQAVAQVRAAGLEVMAAALAFKTVGSPVMAG